MTAFNNTIGLILCGGSSTRMGNDKAMLVYHEKPQSYHLHDMVHGICDQAFLSCNADQFKDAIEQYPTLPDLPSLGTIGPMAGLLTAFTRFPEKDLLVIGCDYPFLTQWDIIDFMNQIDEGTTAAAHYREDHDLYEPLLAWYSYRIRSLLFESYKSQQYSLQHFLHAVKAQKYIPKNPKIMLSVDTPEGRQQAEAQLSRLNLKNMRHGTN